QLLPDGMSCELFDSHLNSAQGATNYRVVISRSDQRRSKARYAGKIKEWRKPAMLGGQALINASNKNKSRVIGISIALSLSAGLICPVLCAVKEPAPAGDSGAAVKTKPPAKKRAPLSGHDPVEPDQGDAPPPMPEAIPPSEPPLVPVQQPQVAPQ